MVKIIGIDDAGRGPVLGPMVLAGVLINDESQQQKLKELGAKDSKLLLPNQRKKIGDLIKKDYIYDVQTSSPQEIDNFPNLNNLEALKASMIINKLAQHIEGKIKVIVDCPSINTVSWRAYLFNLLIKKDKIELIAEHKADANYPVVSAASIVAKEKREEEVARLKKFYNVDFGSGYPSDPSTKDFLQKNWDNPEYNELIRKSWNTYKNIADKDKQKELSF